MSQPAFELVDPEATDADWLGLWTPTPAAPISFSVGGETTSPPSEAMLWRVNLPDTPGEAAAQFRLGETRLQQSQAALATVPQRMDSFVARARSRVSSENVSFSVEVGPGAEFSAQESELLYLLDEAHTGQPPAVSFAVGEAAPENLDQAKGQFQTAMDKIQRVLTHFAWVETNVEGRLLARTIINWAGDTNTLTHTYLDAEQAALHRRAVRLAVASRGFYLTTFITVTQAAVKLSILLSTGNAVLALPVAWKSVNQVLASVSQYRALTVQ